MSKLGTQLNARSADFQANAQAMRVVVDDLRAQAAKIAQGGGEAARAKHLGRGKLLPRDRVQMLLDPGTPFLELAPLAALNMYNNDAPGAGLIAGVGRVKSITIDQVTVVTKSGSIITLEKAPIGAYPGGC